MARSKTFPHTDIISIQINTAHRSAIIIDKEGVAYLDADLRRQKLGDVTILRAAQQLHRKVFPPNE